MIGSYMFVTICRETRGFVVKLPQQQSLQCNHPSSCKTNPPPTPQNPSLPGRHRHHSSSARRPRRRQAPHHHHRPGRSPHRRRRFAQVVAAPRSPRVRRHRAVASPPEPRRLLPRAARPRAGAPHRGFLQRRRQGGEGQTRRGREQQRRRRGYRRRGSQGLVRQTSQGSDPSHGEVVRGGKVTGSKLQLSFLSLNLKNAD